MDKSENDITDCTLLFLLWLGEFTYCYMKTDDIIIETERQHGLVSSVEVAGANKFMMCSS